MHAIAFRFMGEENHIEAEKTVLVDVPDNDFARLNDEINDAVASYIEHVTDDENNINYGRLVKDVMDNCGCHWIPLDTRVLLI